jgi:ATP-dependent helicase/nuclease subunit A
MSKFLFTENQQKALDFHKHLSVTANAGSGKTTVLVNRYLNILFNTDIQIDNLVAITFTEKAASELKKKIADTLDEQINSETDITRLHKIESLRDHFSWANISTIHSFCAKILRLFPVEADVDVGFSILDGVDKVIFENEAIDESLHRFLTDINSDRTEEIKFVLSSLSKKRTKEILRFLLEKREQVDRLIQNIFSKSDEEILNGWKSEIEAQILPVVESNVWRVIANRVLQNASTNSANDLKIQLSKWKSNISFEKKYQIYFDIISTLLTTKGTFNKTLLGKKYDFESVAEDESALANQWFEIKDILTSITDENLDNNQNTLLRITKTILSLFNEIVQLYDHKKNEKSYLDYEDLQIKTRNLLNNPEVKTKLSQKFKYIMIDEYQDTNLLQYEIFLPLLSDLKSGNLFIVGDPKQSIYRFRDADVEIFEQTKSDISNSLSPTTNDNHKSSNIILAESFRLLTDITCLTNLVFSKLMSDKRHKFETSYEELVKGRNNPSHGRIELFFPKIDSDDNEKAKKADLIAIECEMIARRIVNLKETNYRIYDKNENPHPFEFRDAAILLRSRTHLKEIEKAFNKHGIPYFIHGGIGFFQTQEIYDFYNYFRFLLNHNDDVALAGLLRSPFFSVSDAELYEIAITSRDEYFWIKTNIFIKSEEPSPQLRRAVEILYDNIKFTNRIPIPLLVQQVLKKTGWLGTIAGLHYGRQSQSNIEKLLSIAREFEGRGFTNLFDFVERLKTLIEGEEREGQANIETEGNAIQIMTIHSAKGLEFPVVFLPFCDKKFKYDSEPYLENTIGLGFTFFDQASDKIEPLNYIRLKNISRLKTEAEEKRIFYVACTRAKDMLIISGSPQNESSSYLNWLIDCLDINPQEIKSGKISVSNRQVKTLELVDGKYKSKILNHDLKINVYTSPDEITLTGNQTELAQAVEPINTIMIEPLKASIRNDFFSATQIQTYLNCPTKYFLRYKIGLPEKTTKQVYFHEEEDANDIIRGVTLGIIVHGILEKFQIYSETEIRENIESTLISERLSNRDKLNKYTNDILYKIKIIYNSNTVKDIFSQPEYKTEFTINSAFGEDFLTGTIDRLYKDSEGNWCIVDYKTDKISAENIEQRAESYRGQMLFYSLLVRRLFKQKEVRVCILFTTLPDSPYWFNFSETDIKDFENKLSNILKRIKSGELEKNKEMCLNCAYAVDGNCILLSDS